MSDFEDAITKALAEHARAPRWRRALWTLRGWAWPFRWCPYFRAFVCELPCASVAHHRTAWLTTFHPMSHRWRWLVVGFRVHRPIYWRLVWSKDDEAAR